MKTDVTLQHDIQDELGYEPRLDASQIGVTAKNGVVTLTGQVPSFDQKCAAERVAKRVYGVRAVANDIVVAIPSSTHRTDADIATAAVHALQWDASVPDQRIKITVSDGSVTLEGTVEWQFQRDAAALAVRNLTGVRNVINLIVVKPGVRSSDVKNQIESAFRRHAEVDASHINVDAQDGTVCLRGHVRNWTEREEAEKAAWAAPGVANVVNELVVTP
jgi:osmotically-inducible protein OsmY